MYDDCDLFVLYKLFPNGGTIWLMTGFEENGSDYEDLLAIADCLAENGHEVKLLHAVHYMDPLYREIYGGGWSGRHDSRHRTAYPPLL